MFIEHDSRSANENRKTKLHFSFLLSFFFHPSCPSARMSKPRTIRVTSAPSSRDTFLAIHPKDKHPHNLISFSRVTATPPPAGILGRLMFCSFPEGERERGEEEAFNLLRVETLPSRAITCYPQRSSFFPFASEFSVLHFSFLFFQTSVRIAYNFIVSLPKRKRRKNEKTPETEFRPIAISIRVIKSMEVSRK